MWTIKRIDEADYGCEERLPGEPQMLLVTLEDENLTVIRFEVAENWIDMQELDEGDEWPEDIDSGDPAGQKADKQSAWMDNYYRALEQLKN